MRLDPGDRLDVSRLTILMQGTVIEAAKLDVDDASASV